MLALKPGEVLTLGPDLVLHSLPDQGLFYAFSVVTGDHYQLNRTSFWVMEAISHGTEWTLLRDEFLATFEVPPEQGEADLLGLLAELIRERIVRRRGNGEQEGSL